MVAGMCCCAGVPNSVNSTIPLWTETSTTANLSKCDNVGQVAGQTGGVGCWVDDWLRRAAVPFLLLSLSLVCQVWLDQADGQVLTEGEEVTLMDWGNAIIKVGPGMHRWNCRWAHEAAALGVCCVVLALVLGGGWLTVYLGCGSACVCLEWW